MMQMQGGRPRLVHNRPPLRFDRSFLEDRSNQLKLIQMGCGLFALVLTVHCWPNRWANFCVGYLYDFWQLFNAVCVHGFFLIGTSMLALAHLFCVPDAFYHYNFPLLEKFYTALALAMYLLATFFAVFNLLGRASFIPLWLFTVGATFAGLAAYFADFWTRFRRDQAEKIKTTNATHQQQQPCQFIT